LRIGKLRHRVTIQQNTPTRNAHGEMVDTWADVTTVWGEVKQLDGRENFAAQQFDAKTTTLITIRSDSYPSLNPRMRFKWTDYKPFPVVEHTCNILFVDDSENRGIFKQVQCEEQRQ
jgi:SPP1 family predicted phage head-tail adaptor